MHKKLVILQIEWDLQKYCFQIKTSDVSIELSIISLASSCTLLPTCISSNKNNYKPFHVDIIRYWIKQLFKFELLIGVGWMVAFYWKSVKRPKLDSSCPEMRWTNECQNHFYKDSFRNIKTGFFFLKFILFILNKNYVSAPGFLLFFSLLFLFLAFIIQSLK